MFTDQSVVRMLASIRAMRTDNIMVDGLLVPAGWLAEQGIKVQVTREPSGLKADGTIAHAGESYHNKLWFSSDLTALDEQSIFYLPGSSLGAWSQHSVDTQIVYVLTKHEHYMVLTRQQEEKRMAWQQEEDRRIAAKNKAVAFFFDQHGKPASSYRVGQWVATSNGLIWKVDCKTDDSVVLCASNGVLDYKTVSNNEILVPGTEKYRRDFRYMLRGISY